MYVLLNMEKLCFLYKHEQISVLSDLAYLEVVEYAVLIAPIEKCSFLENLTQLEQKQLYKNTVGHDCTYAGAQLKAVLYDIAVALPEIEIDADLLQRQADSVKRGDEQPYLFAPKKKKPVLRETEEHEILTIDAWDADYEPSAEAIKQAAQPKTAPKPPTEVTTVARTPKKAPSAPKTPGAPTGVRKTIWDAAAATWEKSNKKTDKASIKALREKTIEKLVAAGVNPSSAAKGTGEWFKLNIIN